MLLLYQHYISHTHISHTIHTHYKHTHTTHTRTHTPPHQGIEGHGFYGNCVVPIIENTARECELTDRLRQAIADYPQANAVLVRRHGGRAWV